MNVPDESQGAVAVAVAPQDMLQQQQQQQPPQGFPAPTTDIQPAPTAQQYGATSEYDMSTYDPLQAHAYQLSACAGYTGATATAAAVASQQHPQQQQLLAPAPDPNGQQQQQQQQVYYYPSQQQQQQQPGVQYTLAPMPQQQVMTQQVPGGQAYYNTMVAQAPVPLQQQYGVMQTHQVQQQQQQPPTGVAPQQQPQQVAAYATNKRPLDDAGAPPAKRLQMAAPTSFPQPPQHIDITKQEQQPAIAPPAHVPSAQSTASSVSNNNNMLMMDDDEIDPIHRQPPANYAAMTAEEKRRYDRNIREQQRSFKISQQIKELRTVLSESSIPFKPNKFSILLRVVEYIKQLQSRAIMLDAEHRKLITTIQDTSNMVNTGQTPSDDSATTNQDDLTATNEAEMTLVQGLDYKGVFQQCSSALGVAALDGRILACNEEFAAISGFTKEELLRQSVFNLMQNHEVVFRAMGEMLSSSEMPSQSTKGSNLPPAPLYWSGPVNQKNQNLFMNITLTKSNDGLPKFFNCALTASN